MNNLQRHLHFFLKWAITAIVLLPAFTLAHVATDIPVARQLFCYEQPDFWSGTLKDPGCNELNQASGTWPGQQWNEVAKLIDSDNGDDYNDQSTVERLIPDGTLCSAAGPGKEGLNRPSPNWHKTPVTPINGKYRVRVPGTAPHDNMIMKVYLSKPGFNPATTVLKWSDLELIYNNTFAKAQTDNWGLPHPNKALGLVGFFGFEVPIPAGRSGDAILFVRAQRTDPKGEGFYNCSDITIQGGTAPVWFVKGPYLPQGFTPKPGDTVRFRVFSPSKSYNEIVDIEHRVTSPDATIWARELREKLAQYASIVKVGELKNNDVVYNPIDLSSNQIYLSDEANSVAMSIKSDNPDPIDPRPPVAIIKPHPAVKSGERFTMDGTASTVYNAGAAGWQWDNDFQGGAFHQSTATFTAPAVQQSRNVNVNLRVYDSKNKTSAVTSVPVTVNPSSGGGEHPAYKEGTPYAAGDTVSNNGKNYKCKKAPYTSWCAGAAWAYAPGTGSDWESAWDDMSKQK